MQGKTNWANTNVCMHSRIKVNYNVITNKKTQKFLTFIPVTIYQACCIRQRVREEIFFLIFVLFILILVALYQVGSRLRSRHVEFISEFYRWLAAEKSLVGGQWATSYDTNENFADLNNQAFMDHRANLIIRNPNKIKRRIDISRTVENDNLSYFNHSIRFDEALVYFVVT